MIEAKGKDKQLKRIEEAINTKQKKILEDQLKMKDLEENKKKQLSLIGKMKGFMEEKVKEEELKNEEKEMQILTSSKKEVTEFQLSTLKQSKTKIENFEMRLKMEQVIKEKQKQKQELERDLELVMAQ
mmetsp:Transcript_35666/g.34699  ORF Transcript_35666/g.34699 Transcript_35666/m.34699 type:complete len:128 (+) Transcript_35666:1109-1492(+)|eukprot:CAMPEP_0170561968 /NCGR_PEP_ID=MMETSP0211-20121228/58040_1 /TAXON_ID=311385 /ORGANISM="Pseudokeronopsis sp., Strain OXSARD2" /LENGTH=127 /DNA_ID=CAMNT_0010878225 /DNA_START=1101 /DNA_END=1484 /DNA_ORIENTATION=+